MRFIKKYFFLLLMAIVITVSVPFVIKSAIDKNAPHRGRCRRGAVDGRALDRGAAYARAAHNGARTAAGYRIGAPFRQQYPRQRPHSRAHALPRPGRRLIF